jgi:16S rRNA (cytidine1402-2'-O)-methyltransferase
MVIVIAAPAADAGQSSDNDTDELLRRALERGSVKDAVSEVAAATGRSRREVYRRALALAEEVGDGPAH